MFDAGLTFISSGGGEMRSSEGTKSQVAAKRGSYTDIKLEDDARLFIESLRDLWPSSSILNLSLELS